MLREYVGYGAIIATFALIALRIGFVPRRKLPTWGRWLVSGVSLAIIIVITLRWTGTRW